jgi:hypothetical protein
VCCAPNWLVLALVGGVAAVAGVGTKHLSVPPVLSCLPPISAADPLIPCLDSYPTRCAGKPGEVVLNDSSCTNVGNFWTVDLRHSLQLAQVCSCAAAG